MYENLEGRFGAYGIASDSNNNLYVTGMLYGGSITFANQTITGIASSADALILKLDSNGNEIWAKHYGNSVNGYDYMINTVIDSNNKMYVLCNGNATTFGNITAEASGTSGENLYVLKK